MKQQGEAQLVSTGVAARLLGVSRQHVVDMCDDGRLNCVLVGTHRRVSTRDIEELTAQHRELSREETRSLLLGYAVAGRLVADPTRVLEIAHRNLDGAQANISRGSTSLWMVEWRTLLGEPLPELLEALTSKSERSCELRQNSPFAGVLTEVERTAVLNNARQKAQAA